jgi:hypothetical protein
MKVKEKGREGSRGVHETSYEKRRSQSKSLNYKPEKEKSKKR